MTFIGGQSDAHVFDCAQYLGQVIQMLLIAFRVYYNVINVYQAEQAEVRREYSLHYPLENRRAVFQSERHPFELSESSMGSESRFFHILWIHFELVKPR
jgi:hypothetical protein